MPSLNKLFTNISKTTTRFTSSPTCFVIAVLTIVIWAVCGKLFHYSDTWQLVINTGTGLITFLMTFLIQQNQNRDGLAIQAKLDELIRKSEAKNDFIGIEDLTDKEIIELKKRLA